MLTMDPESAATATPRPLVHVKANNSKVTAITAAIKTANHRRPKLHPHTSPHLLASS